MSKFALEYNHQADYDNKVVVEIRLQRRPSSANYKKMLYAIDVLDQIAQMYVKIPPKEVKK